MELAPPILLNSIDLLMSSNLLYICLFIMPLWALWQFVSHKNAVSQNWDLHIYIWIYHKNELAYYSLPKQWSILYAVLKIQKLNFFTGLKLHIIVHGTKNTSLEIPLFHSPSAKLVPLHSLCVVWSTHTHRYGNTHIIHTGDST